HGLPDAVGATGTPGRRPPFHAGRPPVFPPLAQSQALGTGGDLRAPQPAGTPRAGGQGAGVAAHRHHGPGRWLGGAVGVGPLAAAPTSCSSGERATWRPGSWSPAKGAPARRWPFTASACASK